MDSLKLYAILDKEADVISNVFLSPDDVTAGRFMLQNFRSIANDVPADLIKDFLDRVHNTALVKIGECDVQTKQLKNDYNYICDFFDFDIEVKEDAKV